MARVLVTEAIADRGLERLRDAGHDVDVQLDLTPEALLGRDRGRPRPDHPLGHQGHRRGARRRHRPGRRRPGRHRPRQRRRRRRHRARRDGRQRAAVEHAVGRRAHDGAAAGPGPQRPPGPRRARRPAGGSGRSGTASSCPTRRSASSASAASASSWPSGPRLRHAAGGLRPVRVGRARPARSTSSWSTSTSWSPAADFITLHLAKTPETVGLIGAELLAKAKPGIRIVNVARGGIVDEARWPRRSREGQRRRRRARRVRRGADHRRRRCSSSTRSWSRRTSGRRTVEAQDKAGDTIAEQVLLALAGDFVPFAVNVSAGEASRDRAPVPAAGRAARRDLSPGCAGACADGARDRVPGPDRRVRHPHPHAVGAQGVLRSVVATSRCRT